MIIKHYFINVNKYFVLSWHLLFAHFEFLFNLVVVFVSNIFNCYILLLFHYFSGNLHILHSCSI